MAVAVRDILIASMGWHREWLAGTPRAAGILTCLDPLERGHAGRVNAAFHSAPERP